MSVEAATATGINELNDSMNAFMGGLQAQLGRSLGPLKEISEKLGGSKFGKNIKAFGGAIKGMAGASVNAWAMEQLMKLIEPFMQLLKLFEIPINALAMILSMFVNEIFVALLPFFLEFSLLLLELAPVFKILGEIVGKVLVIAINLIIAGFKELWRAIKLIIAWIGENFTWEKIKQFFTGIWDGIKAFFQRIVDFIIKPFKLIKDAWDKSGGKLFGKDGFIALAFKSMLNFGKSIINWFISGINSVISLINKIPGVDMNTIPLLAAGGLVTGPTLAMLGEGGQDELVVPLDRLDEFRGGNQAMLIAQEETNRLLTLLTKQNRDAERWRMRS